MEGLRHLQILKARSPYEVGAWGKLLPSAVIGMREISRLTSSKLETLVTCVCLAIRGDANDCATSTDAVLKMIAVGFMVDGWYVVYGYQILVHMLTLYVGFESHNPVIRL